jgi:pimeloyl-ACP methyl ester carboxylesterase
VTPLPVGDATLEILWHGPDAAAAPTLVFLHEGLGCAAMWRDVPAALAGATGCGALVYSRAGYGGSSPVPPAARPTSYLVDEARALPALLDALRVERAILVGHSDGASIALAARDARILARVVEAPHTFVEELTLASIRRAREDYERGDLRARLARWHGDNVDGAFRGWNGMWLDPGFAAWSIVDLLPTTTGPLLAIQGRDDPYGTLAQLDVLAERCPGPVERLVLDGCGHTPHRDRRAEVLAAMRDFVARALTSR